MKVKDLKNYKDNLYSSLSRDLSGFEKNFMLISGGILTFSITFIKDIVEINSARCIELLFISWALIIISIALIMLTFLKSSLASDKLWKIVDSFIISNELFDEDIRLENKQIVQVKNEVNTVYYKNKKVLRVVRYISVYSFLVGIILLSIFVSFNLISA